MQDREAQDPRSGFTAVSYSAPSRGITVIQFPKKVKRLALKSSLTSKASDGDIIVLDTLSFNEIKTKNMINVLKNLGVDSTALVVIPEKDLNVVKSASNIKGIETAYVNTINVYDILRHGKFIVTKDALSRISEVYA